ncbi:MAG: hypothetical protein ACI8RZ_005229 [Myxococcota bacterium]|jgi:hypothetical protein
MMLIALMACTESRVSVEWESCAATTDCQNSLRCVEQACRTADAAQARIAELSMPPAEVPSSRGIYLLNQPEEGDDPSIELVSLELKGDETIALFQTRSDSKYSRIQAFPPGHRQAMRLVDARTGDTYRMLDLDGIAISPDWSRFHRSQPMEFTVMFDRVPDGVDRVHLVEGEMEMQGSQPWTFLNLHLTEANRYLEEADLPSEVVIKL